MKNCWKRQTSHNNRWRPIAKGHLSDSGDLEKHWLLVMQMCLRVSKKACDFISNMS